MPPPPSSSSQASSEEGMEAAHRRRLNRCRSQIVADLEVRAVCDQLVADGILSPEHVQEIECEVRTAYLTSDYR